MKTHDNMRCNDSMPCRFRGWQGGCTILRETYEDGACPFRKEVEKDDGEGIPE